MKDKDLYKNGSGCADPTVYKAIRNLENSRKIRMFMKDIFKVCKQYNLFIDGEIHIIDRYTDKVYKRTIKYKSDMQKGEK